jgi:hypothetical protein
MQKIVTIVISYVAVEVILQAMLRKIKIIIQQRQNPKPMTPLTPVSVFVPVSEDDPKSCGTFISNDGQEGGRLERKELFCFTKEELIRILGDAFEACAKRISDGVFAIKSGTENVSPNFEEYIKSIL